MKYPTESEKDEQDFRQFEQTLTTTSSDLCATYQTTGRIDSVRALQDADRNTLIILKGLVEADIALMKAQIEAGPEHHTDPAWNYKVRTAKGHKIGLLKRIEAIIAGHKLEYLASRNQRLCGLLMQAVRDVLPEDLREQVFTRFNQYCEISKV